MNKIDFPDDDLSIQIFHGKRLIDDEYEITLPDFSLLSDLDYQKIGTGSGSFFPGRYRSLN